MSKVTWVAAASARDKEMLAYVSSAQTPTIKSAQALQRWFGSAEARIFFAWMNNQNEDGTYELSFMPDAAQDMLEDHMMDELMDEISDFMEWD